MLDIDLYSLIQKPEEVMVEPTEDPNRVRFIFQPLEKGFGVTIGNSLRRVLISSIPGYAIIGVKFSDVLHEFQSIPGVVEDVTDIIMNLKEVRLRASDNKVSRFNFKLKGPGVWTAGDIQRFSSNLEVVNPELHIATLAEDAEFDVELRIGFGKGYVPAEEQPQSDYPIGMLPIDALYSPIKNVIYSVEPFRVGQKTDYESLILDVLTDGTVSPIDAVQYAAKTLIDHINFFQEFKKVERSDIIVEGHLPIIEETEHERLRKILSKPIEDLEISVRAFNCLRSNGIKTLGQLVSYDRNDLLKFRNFGKKSLEELEKIVLSFGLEFGMNVDRYLNYEPKKTIS
ncbi:MAG: DNA-directed RNA polymerase subunit alpha [Candidatus Kapaibacteriales bacterium]